eukprot:1329326-Prymnesium_polylepis.1
MRHILLTVSVPLPWGPLSPPLYVGAPWRGLTYASRPVWLQGKGHALVAHLSPPARSEPHGTFSKFRLVGKVLAGCVNVKEVGYCTPSNFSALWRTLCLLAQRRPAR